MPHHYHNLDELPSSSYRHIYLSPHLDDAALSCGGAIARYAADHQPVLVVTICTAMPDPAAPLSTFAEENHRRWGFTLDEAVAQRIKEDNEALEILSADALLLDQLDAIYRRSDRYYDNATLFGPPAADDSLVNNLAAPLAELVRRFPEAIFYAPLGVGEHVDHQAVYVAATTLRASGATLAFYEDFPYVTVQGALERRLVQLGGLMIFLPSIIDIDASLTRKIGAIEAYASQIATLFGDVATMSHTVTTYAEKLRPEHGTYGERIWLRH